MCSRGIPEGSKPLQAEEKADGAEASTSGRPFYTDECTAFVRGLPQNLEDGELDELFADSGGLKDIRIQRDSQTGQAKVTLSDGSHEDCVTPAQQR